MADGVIWVIGSYMSGTNQPRMSDTARLAYVRHVIIVRDEIPESIRQELLRACDTDCTEWIKQLQSDSYASGVSEGLRLSELLRQQAVN